ncbi:hypothetical protein WOLCODRAFT_167158 [Wolfiporia cocos MD-104 SS10]|uniref:Uncharacterized protein n=1 Tax=Wolfiporia cocos (strain MD-104) TaxID=742152 RepID=A0A2H3J3P5_WOLCO|nr:hypothetical protein WOLCODRAFT_167158 [Wolfiporia cocos MD-104 SS10]
MFASTLSVSPFGLQTSPLTSAFTARCAQLTLRLIPATYGQLASQSKGNPFTIRGSKVNRQRIAKHVLLAAEGFAYFALALLDALVHLIPAVGMSINVFKPLDILEGAASWLPLLLYTGFLYLFTATTFIPTMPDWTQNAAKFSLLFFIPAIVASNELGSFVSISYRILNGVLSVGFTNQSIHNGFDDLTLALLTAYQLLVVLIAVYRLGKAFSYRREIQAMPEGAEVKAHLFHGLGWIVAGLVVSAVETMIGFAGGGFALALTRRILLFLGRAGLIIGVINGVDTVEDFQILKLEANQQRRRSKMLTMIGNPRNSTFRKVDGHEFNPDADITGIRPHRASTIASDAMAELRSVSIRYFGGGTRTPRSSLRATENATSSFVRVTENSSSVRATENATSSFVRVTEGGSSVRATENASSAPSMPTATVTSTDAASGQDAGRRDVRTRPPTPPLLYSVGRNPPILPRPQRVTVHFLPGRAPFLELRRFSDLIDQPSLNTLAQLNPTIDPQAARSRSLPVTRLQGWMPSSVSSRSTPHISAFSTTSADEIRSAVAPAPSSPHVSEISVPSSALIIPVVRADRAYARRTYGGFTTRLTQELRQESSSDSFEGLQAITAQFPGTPRISSWTAQTEKLPLPSRSSSDDGKSELTVKDEQASAQRTVAEQRSTVGMSSDDNADVSGNESSDNSQAAASFPTPTSMTMPVSPKRSSRGGKARLSGIRVGKQRVQPETESTVPLLGDLPDPDVITAEGSRAPRIKSIGEVPRRQTPIVTSGERTRDSVVPEVEINEPDSSRPSSRRTSRKLRKRSIS